MEKAGELQNKANTNVVLAILRPVLAGIAPNLGSGLDYGSIKNLYLYPACREPGHPLAHLSSGRSFEVVSTPTETMNPTCTDGFSLTPSEGREGWRDASVIFSRFMEEFGQHCSASKKKRNQSFGPCHVFGISWKLFCQQVLLLSQLDPETEKTNHHRHKTAVMP